MGYFFALSASISRMAFLSKLHCSMTFSSDSFINRESPQGNVSGMYSGKQSLSKWAGMGIGGV
ncbi:hypothetical protein BML2496_22120 [Providencia rettgeri]|nr:hypothetical protein BML2496_22120 [Providencia rettgeri]